MPASVVILLAVLGISVWGFQNRSVIDNLILQPFRVVRENRYDTLVTSGFIHTDWTHLIFNMVSFYFFAVPLERFIGTTDFLIIYFGSLILADVPALFKHRDDFDYRSLGASGAVSGAMFAFILYSPSSSISLFLLPIGIPAPIFAVLYLAYSYYASKQQMDMVNHEAHLWGALSGLMLALVLNPEVGPYFISEVMSWFALE
jgi:membrane associated rhomboid family serine protease